MRIACSYGSEHTIDKDKNIDTRYPRDFNNGLTGFPGFKMYPYSGVGIRSLFKVDTGKAFNCPPGTKMTGMRGKYNNYIGNMEIQCK